MLCRRLASLNEEFISHKSPSAGFDFTSGKRIEQKLLDYNQEAERFGGVFYFPFWPLFWVSPKIIIKINIEVNRTTKFEAFFYFI